MSFKVPPSQNILGFQNSLVKGSCSHQPCNSAAEFPVTSQREFRIFPCSGKLCALRIMPWTPSVWGVHVHPGSAKENNFHKSHVPVWNQAGGDLGKRKPQNFGMQTYLNGEQAEAGEAKPVTNTSALPTFWIFLFHAPHPSRVKPQQDWAQSSWSFEHREASSTKSHFFMEFPAWSLPKRGQLPG